MVISILFAMLLPSLSRAREKARQGVCMANLKQLGLSVRSYAIDHSGWYPNEHVDVSNASSEPKMALDRLLEEGYLGSAGVYKCPSTAVFDTRMDSDDHIVDPSYLYLADAANQVDIFVEDATAADSSIIGDRQDNHVDRNGTTFYGNVTQQDGRVAGVLGGTWYLDGIISVDMQVYLQTENDTY